MTGSITQLSYLERLRIWQRARPSGGLDPLECRTDETGLPIRFSHYGDFSRWGWRAVPMTPPQNRDTLTEVAQLKPVHWVHVDKRSPGTAVPAPSPVPVGRLKPV